MASGEPREAWATSQRASVFLTEFHPVNGVNQVGSEKFIF